MTQNGEQMASSIQGKQRATGDSHRPLFASHYSSSVPATPRQQPRDMGRARTPSPRGLQGRHSPRSVSSESATSMPSLRPTNPACRFQSTQTSRRRMPYTIGSDMLEKEKDEPRSSLRPEEDRNLCGELNALYDELLPSAESQSNRERVVEKLRAILQEEWPNRNVDVSVFGSSGNLLCTSKSDVDVCISVRSLETVCSLAELLARRGMKNVTCVHAKAVPIVKIWDPQYHMACDLNVNNHVALRNTSMVKTYMQLDKRVRPLALIVKYWTKQRLLNEASGGTLSSYTWTLLVIHFLQTRQTPILPVLPLTDEAGKQKNGFSDDLERHRGYGEANKESLGELFFQFFRRYGHEIDYETTVISVRAGALLSKREKNWHLATNNRLCVEEPFNTDRNLGNTADDTAFRGLHIEIRRAFSRIAEGKSLKASICEPFEFPAEEPKPIFERPQPGPRPILSRSTSQSGRGGRRGGRGNRNYDFRGANGRRSSSAAAYGQSAIPGIQSSQLLFPNDYFFPSGAPVLSSADLDTLSRQIDQKQQQLRLQQLQIHQYQLQAQAQAMAANQQRSSSGGAPMTQHQRMQTSGYSSPHLIPSDMAPGSAPLNPPYPYGTSAESSVPMSHSSSAQDANTNPSSPMLGSSTPHRRGLQRGVPQVGSPGAAVRSQSQPARTMAPHLTPSIAARSQYNQMPVAQFPMHAARPLYLGPYMGPYGSFYVAAPTTESLPREYLGYGIGGTPQFATSMPEQPQVQIPPYEDLVRQGRQLSPSRRHSSMATTHIEVPEMTSSQRFPQDFAEAVESPATQSDFASTVQDISMRPLASEEGAPAVVNGSYYSGLGARPANVNELDTRRVSDPARRPTFGFEASTDETLQRTQSNQSFAARLGASIAASEKARREAHKLNFIASDDSEPFEKPISPRVKSLAGAGSIEMPPPPRPMDVQSMTARKSLEDADGVRRASSGSKASIPPLDLGKSHVPTERAREGPHHASTVVPVLSPVEERRTPPPPTGRKAWQRHSTQLNGFNGISSLAEGSTAKPFDRPQGSSRLPPPPTPLPNSGTQSGASNGSLKNSRRRSMSPIKSSTAPAPRPLSQTFQPLEQKRQQQQPHQHQQSPQQNQNSWQQAGKGKKNRRKGEGQGEADRRTGGQPMPDNIAERKGG